MEQARLLLAIVLSFLVFLVYDYFFMPKPKPPEGVKQETARPADSSGALEPAGQPDTENLRYPVVPKEESFSEPEKLYHIKTKLFNVTLSSAGGRIRKIELNRYKESVDPGSPPKSLIPETNEIGTALLSMSLPGIPELSLAPFNLDKEPDYFEASSKPVVLTFNYTAPNGVVVKRRYTFFPESYTVRMETIVENLSDKKIQVPVHCIVNPVSSKMSYMFHGPFAFIDKKLEEISVKSLKKKNQFHGTIEFTGIEEQYFMTALIPEHPRTAIVKVDDLKKNGLIQVAYIPSDSWISPGSSYNGSYLFYMGPKKISILKKVGHNLDRVVNFGFFDFLARPLLFVMNWIYDHGLHNYGLVIILITIFIKLIFWPLGTKSYKSMAEMKRLQPLMMEIREKYKDDRQKMNEEIMRLYRTYKVNPMSGCLPIVVQIPVFFAFYKMLYGAIELRHAPFALWINDLSAPDRLFATDIYVPFMAPPAGIPVLTLIMGFTMYLQQKLSPPPGDPTQAKIMMAMPLVLTVLFINFPSGLVLYWLTNNVLSIVQQYMITSKQ